MSDLVPEPEILTARKAFFDAQAEMDGLGTRFGDAEYTLGWFGTRVSEERGSFAIVAEEGPLAELVGDTVRLWVGSRSVLAYVVGDADIEYDIGITRRLFAALADLALEDLQARVEVIS